jgi:LPS-assembly protein
MWRLGQYLQTRMPQVSQVSQVCLILILIMSFAWLPAHADSLPQPAASTVFLSACQLETKDNRLLHLEGDVQLDRDDLSLSAQHLDYDRQKEHVVASGPVGMRYQGNWYQSQFLDLDTKPVHGQLQKVYAELKKSGLKLNAQRLDIQDNNHLKAYQAQLSSCSLETGRRRKWSIQAKQIDVDMVRDEGTVHGGSLHLSDIPVLAIPLGTFPLSDKRRSGFLAPMIAFDNLSGTEITTPYYANLAPNYDLTLTPSVMSKRGTNLSTEFRYLQPNYNGRWRFDNMGQDALRNGQSRTGLYLTNQAYFSLPVLGTVNGNVEIARVSDENYWRDFVNSDHPWSGRLLPNNWQLQSQSGTSAGAWTYSLRALRWQTIQDPAAPITPPYDLLPQVQVQYQPKPGLGKVDPYFEGEWSRFQSDSALTGQPNSTRSVAIGQLEKSWTTPGRFFTPRLQSHWTQYSFNNAFQNQTQATRWVPTLSTDSGWFLERPVSLGGKNWVQTLEPRLFYVYTPYVEQSLLPNYDAFTTNLSWASLFSPNTFSGKDRIADANLVTWGLGSRFLDAQTGEQKTYLGLAQRLRLSTQRVTLPGQTPVTEGWSDMFFSGAAQWTPRWGGEGIWQYDPSLNQTNRTVWTIRHNQGAYRTWNLAYRLEKNMSEQIDTSWQWPLELPWRTRHTDADAPSSPGQGLGSERWYTVGRLNYSSFDRRLINATLGVEYDGGCLLTRVVVDQTLRSDATANRRIMFQLELIGLTRLGISPIQVLRQNVPTYELLRHPPSGP